MPTVSPAPWTKGPVSARTYSDAVQEMTMSYIVSGLDTSNNDHRNILAALSASGIPADGSSPAGYANLILEGKEVEKLDEERDKAIVRCNYVAKGNSGLGFKFEIGTSLFQERRFTDANGQLVIVYHNFGDGAGLQSQQGEFDGLVPTISMRCTGVLSREFPQIEAGNWVGRTNSNIWFGSSRGFWLCTNVSAKSVDTSSTPPKWQFTFDFEGKVGGWQPAVSFKDDSGNIPVGIVAGLGYKTLIHHLGKNYGLVLDDSEGI